jgi:hypothetical protein
MSDQPFVGRIYFEMGSGGSPEEYTRICEINGISGLGETSDQVDVTTFCSRGVREYISGLADGAEITLDANFIVDSDGRRALIAAQKAKQTRSFRVVVDDDGDDQTDLTFWFRATVLSWTFQPQIADKNAIQFTLKISGEIDITEP